MKQNQIELIKQFHKGQYRAGNIEYWKHLENVSLILENAIKFGNEIKENSALANDMIACAWCHDLLEDTSITENQILSEFGPEVLKLTKELTNFKSDNDIIDYMAKLESITPEALLVKICDCIDNLQSVSYQMFDLGLNWTQNYFIPIIEPTINAIQKNRNFKYPNTFSYLQNILISSYALNKSYIDYFKSQNIKKKIVYVDMDNVLVDFQTGINRLSDELKNKYEGNLDDVPGIFSLMDPIPDSIESIKLLSEHFELYVLSTAPWKNPSAWSDKAIWIQKYYGEDKDSLFHKRLIISHQKNLNKGDFLIDDREKNGAKEFSGELIRFGSDKFLDWKSVTDYLMNKVK